MITKGYDRKFVMLLSYSLAVNLIQQSKWDPERINIFQNVIFTNKYLYHKDENNQSKYIEIGKCKNGKI